jgi:hypothetical protein
MASAMLVPVPPTSPTSFAAFLLVDKNDHFQNRYHDLMALFNIGPNPPTPAIVRALVAKTTAQQKAVCFIAFVDGKLQVFFLPFRLNTALGAPVDATTNGKLFAYQGELIQGVGLLVEIPDDWFNLTTAVVVPLVASAQALLAVDVAPTVTFGPYAVGDANTMEIRTRKVCILPTKYAGYFLSEEGGIEPRKFINDLLPVIVSDNQAVDMIALTHFVLLSMTATTGNGAAGSHVTAPIAVPHNVALITHANTLLHHHITGLRNV